MFDLGIQFGMEKVAKKKNDRLAPHTAAGGMLRVAPMGVILGSGANLHKGKRGMAKGALKGALIASGAIGGMHGIGALRKRKKK